MSKRRDPSRELPRPMTGDDLARFASAAYGAVGWQSALARDLGLSRASVNRWARGQFLISDDWALSIGAICLVLARRKHADLRKAHRRMLQSLIELRRPAVTPPQQRPWRPLTPYRARD